MNIKYIVGGIVILAFIVLAAFTMKSTMTPYVSIEEAKMTGMNCQVKGTVVSGSAVFDMNDNIFKFQLADERNDIIQVIHNGVKPGNFDQATEVVVMGSYKNGIFNAGQILVKCPSKYEAEGVNL